MPYYAGLDVSNQTTNICVIDADHKIIFETQCATEPVDIAEALTPYAENIDKVGLEAGALSFWLVEELRNEKLPAICLDSRHVASILSTVKNKTDKNDARGIAKILQSKFYTEVHQKSAKSIEIGMLMQVRSGLVADVTTKKNRIRGILKSFGIRIKQVGSLSFASAVRFAIKQLDKRTQMVVETALKDYEQGLKPIEELDREVDKVAKSIPEVQVLQTIPGVGPITALSFIAEIDDPNRFAETPRNVGAFLGLTPKQHSSGESTVFQGISKAGSGHMRTLLYEAAVTMLTRSKKWSKLKAWGLRLQKKKPFKQAVIALARQLAVVMLRMWQTGKTFRFSDKPSEKKQEKRKKSISSSKQSSPIVAKQQDTIKIKPSGPAPQNLDQRPVCLAS